jgi:DNA-binding NtrC family response regulator
MSNYPEMKAVVAANNLAWIYADEGQNLDAAIQLAERAAEVAPQRADVRVVSATNADLAAMIRDGRFREDLLFRINTVEICIPPLRERREEIVELATAQLERKCAQYGREVKGFDAAALSARGRCP